MKAENIMKLANLVANPGPALVQNAVENPEALGQQVAGSVFPAVSAWNLLSSYRDMKNKDSEDMQLGDYMMSRNTADQGLSPDGSPMQDMSQAAPAPISQLTMQPLAMPQGSGMGGVNNAFRQLMDFQLKSQKKGEEELGTLKERLEKLKAQPMENDSLARTLAAAADVWGGGGGQFTKLQGALNPNMSEAQKATAIAQLEDTIRKGRGDLTSSETALLKAQLGYETDKAALAAKSAGGGGAQLPAGQAAELADLSTVTSQVDRMGDDWLKMFGKDRSKDPNDISQTGYLNAKIPGTPENVFEAKRKQWAQTIGVPLEGGKLTDPDYQRYLDNFIPSSSDSLTRAKEKAQNLRKYAAEKQAQRLKAFGMAGYDTSGFGAPAAQKPAMNPALEAELRKRGLIQ